MNIVFRTDASNQIGIGHFMRCLTLACELQKKGAHIWFLSRNLPVHFNEILNKKGMELIVLPNVVGDSIDELAHASWLSVSQARDAEATIKVLSNKVWDWIVVDHYALDIRWESSVRQYVKKIMVIDDLADRQHNCDILLDQNYYADMLSRYNGKVPSDCQLLLGPRYALLREEFGVLRNQAKVRMGSVKSVLVFFGGVDSGNYTTQVLEALSEINTKLHVEVVIGTQNPFKKQIKNTCKKHDFILHVQTPCMAKLMSDADLAIGAGGTAIWERCCLGLTSITLGVAENQHKQISDAAELGILYAPKIGHDLIESIQLHFKSLLNNPSLIKLISQSAMKIADGKGSLRVASYIESRFIEIKKATLDDSVSLFKWRNNIKVRQVSINPESLSWDQHQKWLNSALTDRNRELVIGVIDNMQIGVVRFDIKDERAEVSIYLNPEGDHVGKGKNLLLASQRWLKINRPEIKAIHASVFAENESSVNLFIGSNYQVTMINYKKDL